MYYEFNLAHGCTVKGIEAVCGASLVRNHRGSAAVDIGG
jgi:hypothetical protein